MSRGALLVLVAVGAGLGGFLYGARTGPVNSIVSRIDTVLADSGQERTVRDSLRQLAESALQLAQLRIGEARRARLALESSLLARRALEVDLGRAETAADSLRAYPGLLAAYRDGAARDSAARRLDSLAFLGAIKAARSAQEGERRASSRVAAIEPLLADARKALGRLRPRPWSAGALFEPGRAVPVGGYLERDIGRLALTVSASDGPNEPATLRLGAGWRF